MRSIEDRYGKRLDQVLCELYYGRALTQVEVAAELGVPVATVAGWMVRLGINPTRLAHDAAAAEAAGA